MKNKKIFKIDNGKDFGLWNDSTSKLMYFDTLSDILSLIKLPKKIADYGGANGILKKFIPNIITIDIDPTKEPDIVDDILQHKGKYDLIIIRYVLHYLNDYELLTLFNNIQKFHNGKVLIIQFCNNDLKNKYFNSKNELKYFRTENQLEALIPKSRKIYSKEYICTKEFYKNRLKYNNAIDHIEKINAYMYNTRVNY